MAGVVDAEFDRILRGRLLETVFQPIVRLGDGSTVAFEALVRGPKGSRFASAPALLAEAYRTGRVTEFDWVARASACRAAMAAGLSMDIPLFVNIEPLALDTECPADLREDIDTAYRRLHIVLEVTERSLDRDPASLLDGIARVRDAVGGLAVDDVGANAATLRMLAVLQPELIKLDPHLLACEPSPVAAGVLDCVYAESERTGAALLAEGVQNADQADVARSIGVQLAQGRLFGHPGPLPASLPRPGEPLRVRPNPGPNVRTPFAAAEGRPLNRATAQLLTPLTRQLPSGESPPKPGIQLVLLPDPELFGPEERAFFREEATKGTLTGILGPDVAAYPDDPIRGGRWEPDDELSDQWAVISLSPHTARAFLARRAADDRSKFEFTVTHDWQRVIAAARSLLRRLEPPERGNNAPSNREIR